NIGKINGGEWTSSVASECTFDVRVGLYPGKSPQDIKDEVYKWLMKAAKRDEWLKENIPEITYYGFHAEGAELDKNNDLFKALEKSHYQTTNKEMDYIAITATTDIRFFNNYYNIPATCNGAEGSNMHVHNEWVDL